MVADISVACFVNVSHCLYVRPRRLAGMEVQCYSKDSSGYYCELCEFNFTAPLDYTLSLEKCIAKNADPVSS